MEKRELGFYVGVNAELEKATECVQAEVEKEKFVSIKDSSVKFECVKIYDKSHYLCLREYYYFIASKELLEKILPGQHPEAAGMGIFLHKSPYDGTITVAVKPYQTCDVSDVSDGSRYDHSVLTYGHSVAIRIPVEEIEWLYSIYENGKDSYVTEKSLGNSDVKITRNPQVYKWMMNRKPKKIGTFFRKEYDGYINRRKEWSYDEVFKYFGNIASVSKEKLLDNGVTGKQLMEAEDAGYIRYEERNIAGKKWCRYKLTYKGFKALYNADK